eukprot:comp23779_c2_seq1/m.41236 comp23779_c2_seq1/g.41236  ORF comp23779_c2_seq1/g.41236 comp23779_c2_seq1/m.41236 type:complete len:313 (+) comp23779_c2_seq1:1163-2101(+)
MFGARLGTSQPIKCLHTPVIARGGYGVWISLYWPKGVKPTTEGLPVVSVPVLSNTTAVTLEANSKGPPPLIRTPWRAPRPVPTMTAVGVARPRAHGQAMTSTVMRKLKARRKGVKPMGMSSGPSTKCATHSQTAKVMVAMTMTAGTNLLAILSATAWMGALFDWASSTNRVICDSTVAPPTRVVRTCSTPWPLMLPPMTSSPTFLCTGMDSPVTMDSSAVDCPNTTTPSLGILSPGTTFRISPICTNSMPITLSVICPSLPFSSSTAVVGCMPINLVSASEVLAFVIASSNLPNTINVMIMADASKKVIVST